VTITVDALRKDLQGRELPGGEIVVEAHESAIGDEALRASPDLDGVAHPYWFIVASLRCMGISVDELCSLARQSEHDTLLFGECEVVQDRPLRVGGRYLSHARIADVASRVTRDGSRLDSLVVVVDLHDTDQAAVGTITSTYLFKRGAAS
jgi:hypothetical protein